MLKLNHTFIRGGAMVAFASLFVNAAMADISVERLNTYKANIEKPTEYLWRHECRRVESLTVVL